MLYDPLNFDYDLLHGQRVTAVRAFNIETFSNHGTTFCDEIAIILNDSALVVSVDPATDEIILHRIEEREALSKLSAWNTLDLLQDFVGKELGWCWVGRNYRGYADMFVLSVSVVEPQIALVGMASSLAIYKMLQA